MMREAIGRIIVDAESAYAAIAHDDYYRADEILCDLITEAFVASKLNQQIAHERCQSQLLRRAMLHDLTERFHD